MQEAAEKCLVGKVSIPSHPTRVQSFFSHVQHIMHFRDTSLLKMIKLSHLQLAADNFTSGLRKKKKVAYNGFYTGYNTMSYHTSDQDDGFDFLFKIVLIGDAGVGKTCVVQRFKSGTYIERHGSTIGVDFTMKTLNIEGKRVKVIFCFISRLQSLKFLYTRLLNW